MALRRISAGFVERIDFGEIAFDARSVESAKTHLRYFLETVHLPARQMADEDRGPHFVRSPAQACEEFLGVREIPWFANDLAIKRDNCIRAQDHRIG
ncbi:MAG: hypothetical protein QOH88_2630 [Verrucomicrobiota bacterium]